MTQTAFLFCWFCQVLEYIGGEHNEDYVYEVGFFRFSQSEQTIKILDYIFNIVVLLYYVKDTLVSGLLNK